MLEENPNAGKYANYAGKDGTTLNVTLDQYGKRQYRLIWFDQPTGEAGPMPNYIPLPKFLGWLLTCSADYELRDNFLP